MNKRIKILILAVGTNANYHIVSTLKEKFNKNFYIIGTDINSINLISCGGKLDRFYKVSPINSINYYQEIIDICRKEKPNYILPSLDSDQLLFNSENCDLKKLSIKSLGTPFSTLKIYRNKKIFLNYLKKKNFPLPKIYIKHEIIESENYFVKPIDGYGSKGAKVLRGSEIPPLINNLIIQEICSNPEITLECFYCKNKLRTIARERIQTKAGVCTKTKIFYSAELTRIAKRLVKLIKVPMYFNIQFMKNKNNDYVIIDINLRTAGGMSLSYSVGWDVTSSLANYLLGNNKKIFKSLPNISGSYNVVRVYKDIVTSSTDVIAFDLDGTILDSRKRHIVLLKDIMNQMKVSINIEDYLSYKRQGFSTKEYLLLKGLSKSVADKINRIWIDHIEDLSYLILDKIYPDFISLFYKFNMNKVVLITARRNTENLYNQLNYLNLKNIFSRIFIVNPMLNPSKEKANLLIKIKAKKIIGDTYSDALAAKIANIPFIFHKDGFNSYSYIMNKLKNKES